MAALSTLYKISAMLALGAGIVFVYKKRQLLLPAGDGAKTLTGDAFEFVNKGVVKLSASTDPIKAWGWMELGAQKIGAIKVFENYAGKPPLEFLDMTAKELAYYTKDTRRILTEFESVLTPGESQSVGLMNDFFEKLLLAKQMDDFQMIDAMRESYTKAVKDLNPRTKMEDYGGFNIGWDELEEFALPGVGTAAKRLKDNNIIVNIDEKLPVAPIKSWMEKAGAQLPTGKKAWGIFDTEAKK
jgi:hypothetical protein